MNRISIHGQVVQRIRDVALAKGATIATAESCTGGLVGAALTDLSGSSEYYWGGVIAYDNLAKSQFLGVSPGTLTGYGAVSSETAREMVVGLLARTPAIIGLSVTGIAGPSGGTEDKPVGLVWFGVGTHQNSRTISQFFKGDRESIRSSAVQFGLNLIEEELQKLES